MTAQEAIFDALTSDTGVTDLAGTRIYAVRPEQGPTAPYVIFQQIAGDPGNTHNEVAGASLVM